MLPPRLFIGSSVESLDVAYSVQESLEHSLEVTVWDQGIFQPNRYAMEDLANAVAESDFALFVFSPDDVTVMRGTEQRTVRDNVVFELGMFIGRLGRERCFILIPRDSGEIHLPSDLLGLTPLTYAADRTDGNLVAALGPACQRVRRSVSQHGAFSPPAASPEPPEEAGATELLSDTHDIIAVLVSWMGKRRSSENSSAIRYAEVDHELRLVPGSAQRHLAAAAQRWNYTPDVVGPTTILFRKN